MSTGGSVRHSSADYSPGQDMADCETDLRGLSSSGRVIQYSDRFIPTRTTSSSLFHSGPNNLQPPVSNFCPENEDSSAAYSMVLKSELLGCPPTSPSSPKLVTSNRDLTVVPGSPGQRLLRFQNSISPRTSAGEILLSPYSSSPVGQQSPFGSSLSSPQATLRKIARSPFKVLDAPCLRDDFYLNLVDWSSQNVLAVGLGPAVYLWNAYTSKVTKLCDLGINDDVCSVSWTQRGSYLAIGTVKDAEVQLWDVAKCKKIRTMCGHRNRVGTLAWNSHVLSSGSRDRTILQRDVRAKESFFTKLQGHRSEVCGLKWSWDDRELASGGNDNQLFVWNLASQTPTHRFGEHTAAVKAIAWSPHQHGLLASGGGTADRCIRFWNTSTSAALNCIDTGSQVCNLAWSKNVNEVVSTHGYSQNQIVLWRYPRMSKLATLTGHTMRVLYLSMSPDGQTIVTGAGDETLRFWGCFPGPRCQSSASDSKSGPFQRSTVR
uniref:Cell division cycle 20-like protein 1, cofactor of APC complex n=1 Tax=Tetraselmis sp. GSL018 TaxID=582737 RepID=A0A061SLY3_9CHLO|mmetsp:Transcript_7872/g.18864  ORF Transcript_7872/g.18864 Transcript_7872/m.18864 type:complete len:489 (+) Transcript_7872:268-1734(+)